MIIPRPSAAEVKKYLAAWDKLENYVLQERSLDKLFVDIIPENKSIEDVLIKASTLNDFYSTNIFSIFPVAKHILELDIDERLREGDMALVDDIANITISGRRRYLYSFASKYCSHHCKDFYPIYDSYVEKVLIHFRKEDRFASFTANDLKDYAMFKATLNDFAHYYGLSEFGLKELDRYLWQLGKDYFPKQYKGR